MSFYILIQKKRFTKYQFAQLAQTSTCPKPLGMGYVEICNGLVPVQWRMKFNLKCKSFHSRTCISNVICNMMAMLSQHQCFRSLCFKSTSCYIYNNLDYINLNITGGALKDSIKPNEIHQDPWKCFTADFIKQRWHDECAYNMNILLPICSFLKQSVCNINMC